MDNKLPEMSQATWHDSIMQSFNLSGESQSNELTAEAEARIRALADHEARKAQRGLMAQCPECKRVFDLLNESDANEFTYGHDCEV